jgi:phosphocarrier protein HPr
MGDMMKTITVKVSIATGFHARPAAMIVSQATKFKCKITAQKGDKKANMKSLMDLLSLGICQNDQIIIQAEGTDETEALTKISKVIDNLDNQ